MLNAPKESLDREVMEILVEQHLIRLKSYCLEIIFGEFRLMTYQLQYMDFGNEPAMNEDEDDLMYDEETVELADSPMALQSFVVAAAAAVFVAFP